MLTAYWMICVRLLLNIFHFNFHFPPLPFILFHFLALVIVDFRINFASQLNIVEYKDIFRALNTLSWRNCCAVQFGLGITLQKKNII
jgi:hypothetical protein